MTAKLVKTPEQIWKHDLFDRKADAEMLIGYIESVWNRPVIREDGRAYTIAVDAGYGEGKTFFLRRLAEHLNINHPVAFVDAWADDIADQPLTALAATLKKALGPLIDTDEHVHTKWQTFLEKTGKVAWIATKGLARRGATIAITGVAVDGISDVLGSVPEAAKEAVTDGIKDAVQEVPAEIADTLKIANPAKLMASRIAEFEAGEVAILDLKNSLAALVQTVDSLGKSPPIVIIIDELDRCRPTYSVKLMEEIKHLFDVPGLVFIFGMHGDQLAHSMGAAYGVNFDGPSYLRRFVNRRYMLSTPDLSPLVSQLLEKSGLTEGQLVVAQTKAEGRDYQIETPAVALARYMQIYGLKARDAFGVVDILQTCTAITNDGPLIFELIVPLAISYYLGGKPGDLREAEVGANWSIVLQGRDFRGNEEQLASPQQMANNLHRYAKYRQQELMNMLNEGDKFALTIFSVTTNGRGNRSPFLYPARYGELLRTVGRFRNPQLENQ